MWTSSVVLVAQERRLGRAGGEQQVTRRHTLLEWQPGARQDADFSAILVSKMTVSAHVWALNHSDHSSSFQPVVFVVVVCLFSFVLFLFKLAASQLALAPPTKTNTQKTKPKPIIWCHRCTVYPPLCDGTELFGNRACLLCLSVLGQRQAVCAGPCKIVAGLCVPDLDFFGTVFRFGFKIMSEPCNLFLFLFF